MRALLAGRASEQILLGEISAGGGIGAGGDLARATLLATRTIGAYGLGEVGLVWTGEPEIVELPDHLARQPDLARRVREMLEAAHAEACRLVAAHRKVVERIAGRLMRDGSMPGAEVASLIRGGGADGSG